MEGKESLERIFAQLSEEQKEQFRNCKDMDEVMKIADAENVELTDEQLRIMVEARRIRQERKKKKQRRDTPLKRKRSRIEKLRFSKSVCSLLLYFSSH